jgi:hypothetical protein
MPTLSRLTASLSVSTPPRPQAAGWRALVGAIAVLGVCLLGGPPPAAAAPCGPLIERVYSTAFTWREVYWTTNYQAHGFWSTAHSWGTVVYAGTWGEPEPNEPILVGLFGRTWHSGYTETVHLQFYADGTVFFGPYGPFTPECYGDKFLIVNSWDSIEVLTFEQANP